MVIIFDLDDTLYDEFNYVQSGFKAVAKWGKERFDWDSCTSFDFLMETLDKEGRGRIFDRWLDSHKAFGKKLVNQAVNTYRHHKPNIQLEPEATELLMELREYGLYLVTDGHKIVQHNKIQALDLSQVFKKIYITHRYGISKSKPSIHCFKLIDKIEGCGFNNMMYVGDNPAKDFVNLNTQGAVTVRLMKGQYKSIVARYGYDAKNKIDDLEEVKKIIQMHS